MDQSSTLSTLRNIWVEIPLIRHAVVFLPPLYFLLIAHTKDASPTISLKITQYPTSTALTARILQLILQSKNSLHHIFQIYEIPEAGTCHQTRTVIFSQSGGAVFRCSLMHHLRLSFKSGKAAAVSQIARQRATNLPRSDPD